MQAIRVIVRFSVEILKAFWHGKSISHSQRPQLPTHSTLEQAQLSVIIEGEIKTFHHLVGVEEARAKESLSTKQSL